MPNASEVAGVRWVDVAKLAAAWTSRHRALRRVETRDGRTLSIESSADVVRASALPLLVDWEHASESGDTRAAGWVEELRVEPDSAGTRAGIWGRVEWTDRGAPDVRARQYRFLSPVVVGKRDG